MNIKIRAALDQAKADNPYPADVFIERTPDQWRKFHKALKKAGLKADGFIGSHSRAVWDHAIEAVEKAIEEPI